MTLRSGDLEVAVRQELADGRTVPAMLRGTGSASEFALPADCAYSICTTNLGPTRGDILISLDGGAVPICCWQLDPGGSAVTSAAQADPLQRAFIVSRSPVEAAAPIRAKGTGSVSSDAAANDRNGELRVEFRPRCRGFVAAAARSPYLPPGLTPGTFAGTGGSFRPARDDASSAVTVLGRPTGKAPPAEMVQFIQPQDIDCERARIIVAHIVAL